MKFLTIVVAIILAVATATAVLPHCESAPLPQPCFRPLNKGTLLGCWQKKITSIDEAETARNIPLYHIIFKPNNIFVDTYRNTGIFEVVSNKKDKTNRIFLRTFHDPFDYSSIFPPNDFHSTMLFEISENTSRRLKGTFDILSRRISFEMQDCELYYYQNIEQQVAMTLEKLPDTSAMNSITIPQYAK